MKKLGPCHLGLCSAASLALALAFLLAGIWSTLQDERLSPVYTAISCSFADVSLRGLSGNIFGGISLGLATGLVCSNPNEFSLTMEEPQAGHVYIGADMDRVATLTTAPQQVLRAKGSSTIPIDGEIDLSMGLLTSLMPILTESEVTIYLDPVLELGIDVDLLFGSYQTTKTMVLRCGFKMEGFRGNLGEIISSFTNFEPNLGDVACEDEWSMLEPDPVGAEGIDASSFQLALDEEETEDLERLREQAFGAAQGLAYGLFGLCLICSASCAWLLVRQRRQSFASEGPRAPPTVVGSSLAPC